MKAISKEDEEEFMAEHYAFIASQIEKKWGRQMKTEEFLLIGPAMAVVDELHGRWKPRAKKTSEDVRLVLETIVRFM